MIIIQTPPSRMPLLGVAVGRRRYNRQTPSQHVDELDGGGVSDVLVAIHM